MRLLYFHGGPGLNSNPEKHLLSSRFAEVGFDLRLWNEPSALRPDGPPFREQGAFANYLEHAEAFFLQNFDGIPLVLIGHSFGAHPLCYLAGKHPEKLRRLVFVGPSLSLSDTDVNWLTVVMSDYKKHGDDRYRSIQKVLENYTSQFDQNTETGLHLFLQNPRFFDYFWINKERMDSFLSHYKEPGYGIDVEGYFAVRRSFFEVECNPSSIPATVFLGRHDVVISQETQMRILSRRFPTHQVYEFEESGHYPLIEETDRALQCLHKDLH